MKTKNNKETKKVVVRVGVLETLLGIKILMGACVIGLVLFGAAIVTLLLKILMVLAVILI